MARDFELILVRHAQAQQDAPNGDGARALTEKGHQDALNLAKAFVAKEWTWSAAFASPFVRAQQTYQHVHNTLSPVFERIYQEPLSEAIQTPYATPAGDIEKLALQIAKKGFSLFSPVPRIVLFGHNPTLEYLAALLLTGSVTSIPVRFQTASALHLLINAPSHFDQVLVPQELSVPTAIMLGYYDQDDLAKFA